MTDRPNYTGVRLQKVGRFALLCPPLLVYHRPGIPCIPWDGHTAYLLLYASPLFCNQPIGQGFPEDLSPPDRLGKIEETQIT